MYLLILESIGTSELILIGIIALIVFGPRKLPQMAKTIGKTMADFRKTTNEFKATWEKEAEFYKEETIITKEINSVSDQTIITETTIAKTISTEQVKIETPEIKELSQEKINQAFSNINNQNPSEQKEKQNQLEESSAADKRNWL